MTTTVAQLIEFLRQFPPETEVDVLTGHRSRHYEGDWFGRVSLELPTEPWDGSSWWSGEGVEYYARLSAPTLFLGKED